MTTSKDTWSTALDVPLESNDTNTTTNAPQDIIEFDSKEIHLYDNISLMENTRTIKEKKDIASQK